MRFSSTVIVVAILLGSSIARGDAVGTPPCPPGARSVSNPHHGTGWCTPATCETDAECPATPAWEVGGGGPQACRVVGVCVAEGRGDAIGECDVEGAPCTAGAEWFGITGACRVRRHCVPAPAAPTGTPPVPASAATAPAESPAPEVARRATERRVAPTLRATEGGCSVAPGRDGWAALLLTLAAFTLRRLRSSRRRTTVTRTRPS